jgi:nitrate reductase gamma subunit
MAFGKPLDKCYSDGVFLNDVSFHMSLIFLLLGYVLMTLNPKSLYLEKTKKRLIILLLLLCKT